MTTLQQAQALLIEMSPVEKVQLLQMIARDLGETTFGVESTLGICGGNPRIAGTRIPIWALAHYRTLGMRDEAILAAFPTLRAKDLSNAWAYYRSHKSQIESQIVSNEIR